MFAIDIAGHARSWHPCLRDARIGRTSGKYPITGIAMLKRLATALLLVGIAALPAAAQTYPGAEWARTTPEAAGWDTALLAEAHDYSDRVGSATLLIIQHGVIVASWGDITDRLELHSMRKSLLNALIGIAVNDKKINLNATLGQLSIDDTPPALTPEEKQATVQELLESRSGIYHIALYETRGEQRRRPTRFSHPPGTFWYYNNWDFNALGTIYEHAEKQSIYDAFQAQIATPLGMQDYRPKDGRYVTGSASIHPAYTFHMSARDLARFGLLYLHQGVWKDPAGHAWQIVPGPWVHDSTQPISLSYLNTGYGYLWWTAFPDRFAEVMDMPPGGFWADGAKGQWVAIDPADDLVIVHQTDGETVTNKQFGHMMWLILRAAHSPNPGQDP
jgi:CubicO group peptidase (beta-lactamase class C family)